MWDRTVGESNTSWSKIWKTIEPYANEKILMYVHINGDKQKKHQNKTHSLLVQYLQMLLKPWQKGVADFLPTTIGNLWKETHYGSAKGCNGMFKWQNVGLPPLITLIFPHYNVWLECGDISLANSSIMQNKLETKWNLS